MISSYHMHSTVIVLFVAVQLAQAISDKESVRVGAYRAQLRLQSQKMVLDHNSKKKSYLMRMYDAFAEMTQEQLTAKYASRIQVDSSKIAVIHSVVGSTGGKHDVDWRRQRTANAKNGENKWIQVLPGVKNQGLCGACYSYAAISDIQTSYRLRGVELDLSEQHVTDCSEDFGNSGCSGGWMGNVFAFAMLRGIHTEQKYPLSKWSWISSQTPQCYLRSDGQFRIRNYAYTSYRTNDCAALTLMLKHRPVTAALAITKDFFFYGEGVIDECGYQLNHGAVVAGVTEKQGQNYWLVKNSWGEEWGQQGYVRIDRGKEQGNLCRICYATVYSVV